MPTPKTDYEAIRVEVILVLARTPDAKVSDIAREIGVTRQAIYVAYPEVRRRVRPRISLRPPIVPKEMRDTVRPPPRLQAPAEAG